MLSKGIHTCARLQHSYKQMGRIVNKVMNSDRTRKSRYKEPHGAAPTFALPITFTTGKKSSAKTHTNRRVTVLNKVFMKYITDLMATGEVAPKLVGRGIEISHVKVAPDFALVNVYWFAQNESDANQPIEEILKKAAGHLQHELSQLRVIGMVPPIHFIKNKHYNAVKEVEIRLAQVDFGEDFVPTTYISPSKTPVLEMTLSPEIRAKVAELNSKINEEESYEITLPEMRHNVLGFDHSAIMKKIKSSLNKSKLAAKNHIITHEAEEPIGTPEISAEVMSFLDNREQKALFNEFLKKRAIEEKRKLRKISLKEAKLEEELELLEKMKDEDYDIDEFNIDENTNEDRYLESRDK